MWDLIVSVPDHCLSFFFMKYLSQQIRNKSATTGEQFVLIEIPTVYL